MGSALRPFLVLATLALLPGFQAARGQVIPQAPGAVAGPMMPPPRTAPLAKAGGTLAVEEFLMYADTTGSNFFMAPLPGRGNLAGIQRYALRFTPGLVGRVGYVVFQLNASDPETNPLPVRGTGTLRLVLRASTGVQGQQVPGVRIDSVDVPFEALRGGQPNFALTMDRSTWDVERDQHYFITFEVVDASADAEVQFLIDTGSTNTSDDRYFPARTLIYADLPDALPPGWHYRWGGSDPQRPRHNNLLAGILVIHLLAPVPVTPAEGQTDVALDAALRWRRVDHAARYRILVSETAWFLKIDHEAVVTDTTAGLAGLSPGKRYFWVVRAESAEGAGDWSEPRSFSTALATPVETPEKSPSAFTLHPNAPNPFAGSTDITFDLPGAAEVRLAVFDPLGRLVAEPLASILPPGRHRVTWEAQGLASGIYLYRLQAGAQTQTRTMMLLK